MKWFNGEFEAVADISIDFLSGMCLIDELYWT